MKNEPSGTATTVQSNSPWSGAQPYLEKGYKQAEQLLGNPMTYYPNSTVVPFSGQTLSGLNMSENLATQGSPMMNTAMSATQNIAGGTANPVTSQMMNLANGPGASQSAQSVLNSYANGSMMGANPYADAMFNKAAGNTSAQIAAKFAGSGRYGSGAMARSMGDTLGDMANSFYGQQYQQDNANRMNAAQAMGAMAQGDMSQRLGALTNAGALYNQGTENQLKAAALAPSLRSSQYADAQELQRIGGVREQQAANQLQDQMQRYMYNQQAQRQALQDYMATVSGGNYSTGTAQQPLFNNTLATSLGAASTLAGIGGTLFGKNNGIFSL